MHNNGCFILIGVNFQQGRFPPIQIDMDSNRVGEKRRVSDNSDSNSKKNSNYYGPGDSTVEGESEKQLWGKTASVEDDTETVQPKQKPNFGLSGALAKDEATGNSVNGVVLKFSEPQDSAMPIAKWRFYVFKDEKVTETLHLHRQSAYLAGRDTRVAHIVLAHPSCSKQHAVIQFRQVERRQKDGSVKSFILPFIMDLESVHKTFVNGSAIEDSRYYELRAQDCIKFGGSSREYVLMLDAESSEEN